MAPSAKKPTPKASTTAKKTTKALPKETRQYIGKGKNIAGTTATKGWMGGRGTE